MNYRPKRITIYTILLIFLPVILCIDRINVLIDDVFISLRYVFNIINGYGPVLNPGERIEAISNPTWVWLLSGISYLFNISNLYSIFYTSRIVGVLLFIISGILLFRLLKLIVNNEDYAFFLTLIYSLNPYIASYAISGMENALVYLLLIIFLYFNQLYLKSKKVKWIILTGFSLGLLSISRPEGFIFIVLYFCSIALIKLFKEDCISNKNAFFALSTSLLIVLAFELWRWLYYGELIPNTIYAKNYFSLAIIKDGFKYFLTFIIYVFGSFVLNFIFIGKFSFKKLNINKKLLLIIVTMFFLANSAITLYAGGDWMPGFRLMLITVPCFIVFTSIITSDSVSLIIHKKNFYIIICLAIFINIYIGRDKLRPVFSGFDFQKSKSTFAEYTEASRKLNEISSSGNTVLTNDLGIISFFNPQLKFVDLYGLADKHIAKDIKGQHFFRSDPDYFLDLNCDYFVIIKDYDQFVIDKFRGNRTNNSTDSVRHFSFPSISDLVWHKDFSKKYELLCIANGGLIFKRIDTTKY
jgi:arabinofuranosyltransferase